MKKILILNFGGKTLGHVESKLKDFGVGSTVVLNDAKASDLDMSEYAGIILAGGPYTIFDGDIEDFDPNFLEQNLPVLGLGRGMQVLIDLLGGIVTPAGYEYIPTESALTFHNTESGIFKGCVEERTVMLGFDAKVSQLPEGFKVLASGEEVKSGDDRPFGAMEYPEGNIYGIQYVIDLESIDDDISALRNFTQDICGLEVSETLYGKYEGKKE